MVKRVSLSDVARAAGVAKATASRALSGREDVGAATRARIIDIATDLGYQPHRIAQALRTGRFGVIAISVPLDDSRAGDVLRAAALRAARHGYQLLVDTEQQELGPARLMRFENMSVDGAVLVGGSATEAGDWPVSVIESLDASTELVTAAIDALVERIAESAPHDEGRGPAPGRNARALR